MSQKGTSVLKNSILYSFSNVLLKVFAFFLIPLYTAFLTPEQYGIVNLAFSFTGVVCGIITLGLQYGAIRFYADYRNDQTKLARMIGTIICSISLFSILFFIILLLLKNYWVSFFFKNIAFYPIVFLSILSSLFSALYALYQDILKGMQQAKKSVILTYVFFFLLLGANLITVVVFKLGAVGILLSTLLINLVMTLVMFIDLRMTKLFTVCIDMDMLKGLLKYSLPIVPHTMSYTISSFFTRIIINSKLSSSSLGLFSLAFQFSAVADIISNSVQSAFQPWFFSRLSDTNQSNISVIIQDIRDKTYLLMWIYGVFYICIGAFSEEAVLIMADVSYQTAWIYIPLMIVSIALKSPLYFYNNFLYYDKTKTIYIFYTTFIGCLANVALTFFMVPIFGIVGSIIASILAIVFRLIIVFNLVGRTAKEMYPFFKLFGLSVFPLIFIALACLPSYFTLWKSMFVSLGYKFFILGLYIAIILYIYRGRIKFSYHGFNVRY